MFTSSSSDGICEKCSSIFGTIIGIFDITGPDGSALALLPGAEPLLMVGGTAVALIAVIAIILKEQRRRS